MLNITIILTPFFVAKASSVQKSYSIISTTMPFRKIFIQGNVEVILVQGLTQGVSYTNDNEGRAKISQYGDKLCITGNRHVRTKLFIYVTDFYRIEADDNVLITTEHTLKIKFLQICLKGNAHAEISSHTVGLLTIVTGNAVLKLSGSTGSHTINTSKNTALTFENFTAALTDRTSPVTP